MGQNDGRQAAEMPIPEQMLREGQTLQRTMSRYTTAVAVQKPRDLDAIVKSLEKEAEYAGKTWFYHWVVQSEDKNTGEMKAEIVEGGSINMAYALAREMGNCAVECEDVRHIGKATYFFPCFIDLEKGTTIQRPFRASNLGEISGRYKQARKDDMRFQIAVSKAERNVIFAGTYKWIEKRLIKKAQDVVAKEITAEGIEKHKVRAIKAFAELGVTEKMLVERLGSPVAQWAIDDVVMLSGLMQAIKQAEALVSELFPVASEKKKGKGEVDPAAVMTPEKGAGETGAPAAEPSKDTADASGDPPAPATGDRQPSPAETAATVPDAPMPGETTGPIGEENTGKTEPADPLLPGLE